MSAPASLPKPWFLTVAIAMALSLLASGLTITSAQESLIPTGAPVDIHSGTCTDIVAEPAYDAGEIEATTTDDLWNDETFQTGIFEDEALQASGVDFNNDGMLQEEEVITPDGTSVQMGHAQGELEGEVNTDEPYVVVVHASPEAYDTYIACGTIDGAQEVDNGTLIYLQPIGDAANFGYAVLDGSTMNTYLFQPNTQPLTGATTPVAEQLGFVGHPVEIHSGVCNDFTAEPVYDIGDFQQTNAYAEGEQEAGDMEGEVPAEAQDLGPVYKLAAQDVSFGDDSILNQGPHVVAVHQSAEEFGNLVACGQILDVRDGDNVVVFLHPVGGNNQVGFVEMSPEGGDANGFLWEIASFDQAESVSTPIPQATPAPVETQEPQASPTQEATAVIVETEVVPAEEATAMAEGETLEAIPVEIGGDSGEGITASANQPLKLTNSSENERTFTVADLELEATVAGGEQGELTVREDAEPGDYTYQVMEGEDVVYEGTLTIQ